MTDVRREIRGLIRHLKSSRNLLSKSSEMGGCWVLEKFGSGALPVQAATSA